MKRHVQDQGFLAETEESNRDWLQDYIHPDDRAHVWAVIHEAIRTKGIFELEHRVQQVDGSLGWTRSRTVPLLDEDGQIQEWFGMASDITESKKAAAALIRSEKLAAMGRLAASIAHEVNNPLEAVTNLSNSRARVKVSMRSRSTWTWLIRELSRAAAITNYTLRFHKQSAIHRSDVGEHHPGRADHPPRTNSKRQCPGGGANASRTLDLLF